MELKFYFVYLELCTFYYYLLPPPFVFLPKYIFVRFIPRCIVISVAVVIGIPSPISVQITYYSGILGLLLTFQTDHDLATLVNTQFIFFFLKSLLAIQLKMMLSANILYSSLLITEYLFFSKYRTRTQSIMFNCRGCNRLVMFLTLM